MRLYGNNKREMEENGAKGRILCGLKNEVMKLN
jgi:hypothetical protein